MVITFDHEIIIMDIHYERVLADVEAYIKEIFSERMQPYMHYHNFQHTRMVAVRCKEIAAYYNIDHALLMALLMAAWFHDIGYFDGAEGHEERGVRQMKRYFAGKDIPEDIVNTAASCIMATQTPTDPLNLLEEIICDADTYNFGTTDFTETDRQVKKEIEERDNIRLGHWLEDTLAMLETHTFYTDYCRTKLNAGKQLNIRMVRDGLSE